MPTGLSNVIAIAAGGDQRLALVSNGSDTNWGASFVTIPPSLTNVMAILAGSNFCVAGDVPWDVPAVRRLGFRAGI